MGRAAVCAFLFNKRRGGLRVDSPNNAHRSLLLVALLEGGIPSNGEALVTHLQHKSVLSPQEYSCVMRDQVSVSHLRLNFAFEIAAKKSLS